MANELAIWSLIVEKVATLEELETYWSLDDVMRVHALLDMRASMEFEARRAANGNRKITSH